MKNQSPPEKLESIFRVEALAFRDRPSMSEGEPLRLSAARLQWSIWALVGALAAVVAVAGSLRTDEHAYGRAIVSFEEAGIPAESGRSPASCLVIGYLPAGRLPAIPSGAEARFALTQAGMVSAAFAVQRIEQGAMPAEMTRGLRKAPAVPLSVEDMVTVAGRLAPCVVMNAGQPLQLREGLEGHIELRLERRRLVSVLLAPRGSGR